MLMEQAKPQLVHGGGFNLRSKEKAEVGNNGSLCNDGVFL